METGTTSFLDRFGLTTRLDENLKPFLADCGFDVMDYGHPVILQHNTAMIARMRKREYKKSPPVLMVKFSPDFVAVHSVSGTEPFFFDSKASITPVFFGAQIRRISDQSGFADLRREDILEIEREAWDVYNGFYPKKHTAIIVACPYHPRLLLGEWVYRVTPLFRFKQDHNDGAGGSGTPHVNLHMGIMRTLEEFLTQEFGTVVDKNGYQAILDFIKLWPLNKPGVVNWTQFNNVIVDLQRTCPWLKTRMEPPGWYPRHKLF